MLWKHCIACMACLLRWWCVLVNNTVGWTLFGCHIHYKLSFCVITTKYSPTVWPLIKIISLQWTNSLFVCDDCHWISVILDITATEAQHCARWWLDNDFHSNGSHKQYPHISHWVGKWQNEYQRYSHWEMQTTRQTNMGERENIRMS